MRTNEERIRAMHRRAGELQSRTRDRRVKYMMILSAAAVFAAVIMLSVFLSNFSENVIRNGEFMTGMTASIFSGNRVAGYFAIAITAFLLGVAFTIFCFCLKRWKENENQREIKERPDRLEEHGRQEKREYRER